MGVIGNLLGQAGGNLIGGRFGNAGAGQTIGGALGSFLPFRSGGMVKPPRGKKTQRALLHKGELVVPASMVKDVPKTLKKKIASKGGRNMKK